jgi:hypothetical protein
MSGRNEGGRANYQLISDGTIAHLKGKAGLPPSTATERRAMFKNMPPRAMKGFAGRTIDICSFQVVYRKA